VTGQLGGSAAALAALLDGGRPNETARVRYAQPKPRIAEMLWLRDRTALHAAIDLSDGLFGDLEHVTAASGCAIVIEPGRVPVDKSAAASYAQAVSGGEDYEIAFTAAAGSIAPLQREFQQKFELKLTHIGEVTSGSGVQERNADGKLQPVKARGYQHFQEKTRS
jgi:thiamine-monophosphate kinase